MRISENKLSRFLFFIATAMLICIGFLGCKSDDDALLDRINKTRIAIESSFLGKDVPEMRRKIWTVVLVDLEQATPTSMKKPKLSVSYLAEEKGARKLFVFWVEASPSVNQVFVRARSEADWQVFPIASAWLEPKEQVAFYAGIDDVLMDIDTSMDSLEMDVALGRDGKITSNLVSLWHDPSDH